MRGAGRRGGDTATAAAAGAGAASSSSSAPPSDASDASDEALAEDNASDDVMMSSLERGGGSGAGAAGARGGRKAGFPHAPCLLWSPLPPITWCLPFIGHTGIATTDGAVHDFAGPYTVNTVVGQRQPHMAFGPPTRYIELDPRLCRGETGFDEAVHQANRIYEGRMHNICCDNCHSHVAVALERMQYRYKHWNMVMIAMWVFFCGKYTSVGGFIWTWLPFCILLGIALLVWGL